VLQCVAVCCSVVQCLPVELDMCVQATFPQCFPKFPRTLPEYVLMCVDVCCNLLQCVTVCCSVLRCVTVCSSVLQCVAVCLSVLRCVAVCCSVLQCVAVCCSV